MDLAEVWIVILVLFYLHHVVRWQMRRGLYAIAELQKMIRSRSLPQLERAATVLSRHPHCSPKTRSLALRCRAWGRICCGRLAEAHNDVALALEWNPKDGRAYLVKAMIDWHSQPAQALRWLELAEQYRDFWGRREFNQALAKFRGLALSRLGRGEEALLQFAAMAGPEEPALRRSKAQALALAGRYQESLKLFEAAGEENPRWALGSFLLTSGRPQESLFWLERDLSEQPTARALFLKAGALYQIGDEHHGDRCMEEWMAIFQRPADYRLHPILTEFGREHLLTRERTASERAQRN